MHFEVIRIIVAEYVRAATFAPTVMIPQISIIMQPERLERLYRTLLDDQETGMLNSFSANLIIMLMLNEVAQGAELKPDHTESVNVVATWVNTYVLMTYDRPITTRTVAKALGFNADYLGRIYRQAYERTLTEAIHHRRMKNACSYLLDTNMSIQQIAHKCGYSDADYFRRIFRRYLQMSPNNYRSEFSHMHVNTH